MYYIYKPSGFPLLLIKYILLQMDFSFLIFSFSYLLACSIKQRVGEGWESKCPPSVVPFSPGLPRKCRKDPSFEGFVEHPHSSVVMKLCHRECIPTTYSQICRPHQQHLCSEKYFDLLKEHTNFLLLGSFSVLNSDGWSCFQWHKRVIRRVEN